MRSIHYKVSDKFLCVTIDSFALRNHWAGINFSDPMLVTLARNLSPVTLRVGGTSQDSAYFSSDGSSVKPSLVAKTFTKDKRNLGAICKNGFYCAKVTRDTNFTFSASDWDELNNFVKKVGWELVFGLNKDLRKTDGSWDSSNAEELVRYTLKRNYSLLA